MTETLRTASSAVCSSRAPALSYSVSHPAQCSDWKGKAASSNQRFSFEEVLQGVSIPLSDSLKEFSPLGKGISDETISDEATSGTDPSRNLNGLSESFRLAPIEAEGSYLTSGRKPSLEEIKHQQPAIEKLYHIRQNPLYMGHVKPDKEELAKNFLAATLATLLEDMMNAVFDNPYGDEEEGTFGQAFFKEEAARIWGRVLAENENFKGLITPLLQ